MLDSLILERTVTPVRPAAPYVGGKRTLASKIVASINATKHTTYAEPFVGMGGVFFRRDRAPKGEIINDLNGEVANFFRILQRHYVHFMEMLRFQLTSRREFERLSATRPETLTDIAEASVVYTVRWTRPKRSCELIITGPYGNVLASAHQRDGPPPIEDHRRTKAREVRATVAPKGWRMREAGRSVCW